jgi:hypothetical protein
MVGIYFKMKCKDFIDREESISTEGILVFTFLPYFLQRYADR